MDLASLIGMLGALGMIDWDNDLISWKHLTLYRRPLNVNRYWWYIFCGDVDSTAPSLSWSLVQWPNALCRLSKRWTI